MAKRRKTSQRNAGCTPTRSLRVADQFWKRWDIAAKLAGVDRNRFVITVVNHAAEQILEEDKRRHEERDRKLAERAQARAEAAADENKEVSEETNVEQ